MFPQIQQTKLSSPNLTNREYTQSQEAQLIDSFEFIASLGNIVERPRRKK